MFYVRYWRHLYFALIVSVIACLTGCGPSDGKFVVEGSASWNGEPIEKGYVEFSPTNGPGQIDGADIVNGKFSFRTNEGEKRVSIIAQRKVGETKPCERIPVAEPIYAQYLPPEFNERSDKMVTVSSTAPTITLDLNGSDRAGGSAGERARRMAQGGR